MHLSAFLKMFHQVNAEVDKQRKLRLQRESEEEAIRICEELKLNQERQKQEIMEANRIIEAETEAIQNRIQEEDLERVIEAALQNPIDHEYAIDLQGNIYRGRYTKSIEVPAKNREKIPLPQTIAERILAGQKSV